eukprot:5609976-Amphidinium_carterae.1
MRTNVDVTKCKYWLLLFHKSCGQKVSNKTSQSAWKNRPGGAKTQRTPHLPPLFIRDQKDPPALRRVHLKCLVVEPSFTITNNHGTSTSRSFHRGAKDSTNPARIA